MKTTLFFGSNLHNRQRLIGGGVLFVIGLICSFCFNGLAAVANVNGTGFWGDPHDGATFDSTQPTQADLVSIHCPVLLAPGEEGTMAATFKNPHEEKADVLVKVVVSKNNFVDYRELDGELLVEPTESQTFRWQITPQDVVENHFVLSRVFLMNRIESTVYPARTMSCGVFTLNLLGLNGSAMEVLFFVISLLGLGGGSVLIYFSDSPIQKVKPRIDYGLYSLAGILLVAMIGNLLNRWTAAGLILALAVILTTILITEILIQDYS